MKQKVNLKNIFKETEPSPTLYTARWIEYINLMERRKSQ